MEHSGEQVEELNIELDDKIADGIYSNLAMIHHSTTEFILDFINVMPGVPKARVRSRIILSPEHAKRLLSALQEDIRKFENQNATTPQEDDEDEVFDIPLFTKHGDA